MAFPGNATGLPVKSIYFPSDRPANGPGFNAQSAIRVDRQGEYAIWYYPVLRLFKIERYSSRGEDKTLKNSGWMCESRVEWFELLE